MISRWWSIGTVAAGALALAACPGAEREADTDADTAVAAGPPAQPTVVERVQGFRTPESVLHHAGDDTWYVSNINGAPTDRDNNGFISRMTADGVIDSLMFIAGGRGSVTLHAPKGMAITGDTLWVTDIDVVRGFNRITGASVATIQFRPAPLFLNDIVAGEDGALYVTDTGIRFRNGSAEHPGPDRIYRVAGRQVTVALEGPDFGAPNGIAWDPGGNRYVVVPFMGPNILGWTPDGDPVTIASGPGGFDGVEVMQDGRILISSWADSSLHVLVNDSLRRLVTGVNSPADIGLDRQRMRVAIPLFMEDRVEIWALPQR